VPTDSGELHGTYQPISSLLLVSERACRRRVGSFDAGPLRRQTKILQLGRRKPWQHAL
jgi:hypothetical protein